MSNEFPILLVEDDPVSRALVTKILQKAAFDVTAVDSGSKALALAQDRFFPILITDWEMPGINGLELCRRFREMQTDGYVFIILLTARDSKGDIVEGLDAGADDYVTKPLNKAELLARINTGIRILELEKFLRQANREIRKLSITDPLTECYNRTFLQERLPQEVRRAIRYGHPLSLIMCDIDHFKKVNDTHGHQAGDMVLREFVQCMLREIRDGVDWLARYGGEEFIVVLPETGLDGAANVAERLRQELERRKIDEAGVMIQVTSSFGATCLSANHPDKNTTADDLIRIADRCLYQAKEAGRNRVVVSGYSDEDG